MRQKLTVIFTLILCFKYLTHFFHIIKVGVSHCIKFQAVQKYEVQKLQQGP